MLWTWGWTDPPWDIVTNVHSSLSTPCACLVLRPEIVACFWDVNWPTLGLSNSTPWQGSYKGSFQVCHETCCEAWSVKMGFAPLFMREILLWAPRVIGSRNAWPCYIRLIVNLVRDSESQDQERVISWEHDQISWGKRNSINMWWFIRCDLYVRLGVGTFC